MKIMKYGRVAIVTRGRFAGKKVIIVQTQETGTKAHPFAHAIVVGIDRFPAKITRRMSKNLQTKRSRIKVFVKVINYNHLMPTRYSMDLGTLKTTVTNELLKEPELRRKARKSAKTVLEERYQTGKNPWFFSPLHF